MYGPTSVKLDHQAVNCDHSLLPVLTYTQKAVCLTCLPEKKWNTSLHSVTAACLTTAALQFRKQTPKPSSLTFSDDRRHPAYLWWWLTCNSIQTARDEATQQLLVCRLRSGKLAPAGLVLWRPSPPDLTPTAHRPADALGSASRLADYCVIATSAPLFVI